MKKQTNKKKRVKRAKEPVETSFTAAYAYIFQTPKETETR